jgi:cytochrome c551/c552
MKKSNSITFLILAATFLCISSYDPTSGNSLSRIVYPQAVGTDKGIGPFQNVALAPIDKEKVKAGLAIFTNKCFLCHELDNIKIGPPLRNVAKDNSPEFVLNMIVNPLEMQKSNNTIKELMKKYNNVPMPDQKISQEDALTIYEYLRSVIK